MTKSHRIPVIDLFAGPGGLGEGFASLRDSKGDQCFRIGLSVEKDPYAHKTLELRSFFRQFPPGEAPKEYHKHLRGELTRDQVFAAYPVHARAAARESWLVELGGIPDHTVHETIRTALGTVDPWVLIGGPPCQAYSVAGRARNKGVDGYHPDQDARQTLYLEYLKVIASSWPAIFVMENVKGLLSARLNGTGVFDRILSDLRAPARALAGGRVAPGSARGHTYQIYSLSPHGKLISWDPEDYVVRAEMHGIPQSRHRIILFGVRDDFQREMPTPLPVSSTIGVKHVLDGLPAVRSGLSRIDDTSDNWVAILRDARGRRWLKSALHTGGASTHSLILETIDGLRPPKRDRGGEFVPYTATTRLAEEWFIDDALAGVCNHSTKAHMASDLHRYLYAACFASAIGESPRLRNFPADLLPRHTNASEAVRIGYGTFQDRFRVQIGGDPGSTITSHIHKDGHYYIHPDPGQCRSLTVREAARIQTFPDNYLFCGPRTEQYKQVGNAVPPLLARDIAKIAWNLLRQ